MISSIPRQKRTCSTRLNAQGYKKSREKWHRRLSGIQALCNSRDIDPRVNDTLGDFQMGQYCYLSRIWKISRLKSQLWHIATRATQQRKRDTSYRRESPIYALSYFKDVHAWKTNLVPVKNLKAPKCACSTPAKRKCKRRGSEYLQSKHCAILEMSTRERYVWRSQGPSKPAPVKGFKMGKSYGLQSLIQASS